MDQPLSQIDTPTSVGATPTSPSTPDKDDDDDDDDLLKNSDGSNGSGALRGEMLASPTPTSPTTSTSTTPTSTSTTPTVCYLHEREVQGVSYEPLGGIQGLSEMGIDDAFTQDSSLQDIASVCALCNEAQLEYRDGTFARIGEPTGQA